jgi:copper chaperone
MMDKTIKVSGMHCRSCEMLLDDSISEVKGVKKVSADSRNGTVSVSVDDEGVLAAVKKVIADEGYKVVG